MRENIGSNAGGSVFDLGSKLGSFEKWLAVHKRPLELVNPTLVRRIVVEAAHGREDKEKRVMLNRLAMMQAFVGGNMDEYRRLRAKIIQDEVDEANRQTAPADGTGQEDKFPGATLYSPAPRKRDRTTRDVSTAEWIILGVAITLIVAIIVMLVFVLLPS